MQHDTSQSICQRTEISDTDGMSDICVCGDVSNSMKRRMLVQHFSGHIDTCKDLTYSHHLGRLNGAAVLLVAPAVHCCSAECALLLPG